MITLDLARHWPSEMRRLRRHQLEEQLRRLNLDAWLREQREMPVVQEAPVCAAPVQAEGRGTARWWGRWRG